MKKYCVLVGLLLAGTGFSFAAEEMQFQTTLSAPIAVFDKVEATNANQYAVAEKTTIGVLTRDSKGINANVTLKGHDARLASLQLTSRTNLKSNNVPIWKTPKMTLRPGGTVKGKQLLLNQLNLKSSNVHQVNAPTSGQIRIKNDTNLKSATVSQVLKVGGNNWFEYSDAGGTPPTGTATWGSVGGGPNGASGSEGETVANVISFPG